MEVKEEDLLQCRSFEISPRFRDANQRRDFILTRSIGPIQQVSPWEVHEIKIIASVICLQGILLYNQSRDNSSRRRDT